MAVKQGAKVMLVFGTRPEAIKMAPVVRALRADERMDVLVAVTGQHRQMLDQVFDVFGLKPDVDMDIMRPGQSLQDVTAAVMNGVTELLRAHRPDLVLVHGDTTSAFAAALAAFYQGHAVGHVEAGLRSFDLARPWPEEFNRVSIDRISKYHFAPSAVARCNLLHEKHAEGGIFVTGNTGIDALLHTASHIRKKAELRRKLDERYSYLDPDKRLILVTGHRRESFGDGLKRISEALALIGQRPDVDLLYPIHLNPNVRDVMVQRLGGRTPIRLIEPVDYTDMVYLMDRAFLLLTDSGGLQEEGPALGRPVLVMRDVTERPEAVETGVVKVVGTDTEVLVREVTRLLDDEAAYLACAKPAFPYGRGDAGLRIAEAIRSGLRLDVEVS